MVAGQIEMLTAHQKLVSHLKIRHQQEHSLRSKIRKIMKYTRTASVFGVGQTLDSRLSNEMSTS